MSKSKWQPPPIIEAALRLQKLGVALKKAQLEKQLQRATKLLEQQIKQAKRNV